MANTSRKDAMKRLTNSEKEMYAEFTKDFPFCFACYWSEYANFRRWMFPQLERAHIVGGSGRVADRRDIVMLCNGCHLLAHGATIRKSPKQDALPNLRIDHLMWLKNRIDGEHYDRDYLCQLKQQNALPPVRQTPTWFQNEREKNYPRLYCFDLPTSTMDRLKGLT